MPLLYDAIKKRQVLGFEYEPLYDKKISVVFHPHYLKEFNGRWFMFGYSNDGAKEIPVPLDRILSEPQPVKGVEYLAADKQYYENRFKNIVGVTHFEGAKVEEIIVRAYGRYMFRLTETKPLHHSQTVVTPFRVYDNGTEYGEFSVKVEMNNEFIGRILQMGAELEVRAPENVRNEFVKRVAELNNLYHKKE